MWRTTTASLTRRFLASARTSSTGAATSNHRHHHQRLPFRRHGSLVVVGSTAGTEPAHQQQRQYRHGRLSLPATATTVLAGERPLSSKAPTTTGDGGFARKTSSSRPSGKAVENRRAADGSSGAPAEQQQQQKQRNNSGNRRTTSPQERTKAVLLSLVEGIGDLKRRAETDLEDLPPVWFSSPTTTTTSGRGVASDDDDDDQNRKRREIVAEAGGLVRRIEACVRDGSLQPTGRHNHEVSVLLERILELYARCAAPSPPPNDGESAFDECSRILALMRGWKVDAQHRHCEYAATVAAREGRWRESADLYLGRIDPDSGFAPYDVDVSNPVGLYAIARNAQQHGASVVDSVFDAVLRMSIVSPTDRDKYIFSAGTAIGYAGEWEAFVNYLRTSYDASEMGQSLVAAVMHACLICDRHDEAFEVFDQMKGELAHAGEWHWGGGEDRIDPLCRDLAIRALGGSTVVEDASSRALELFREVMRDGKAVSIEALCGVVSACQRDDRLDGVLSVFFSVLDMGYEAAWLVTGDDFIASDSEPSDAFHFELLPDMGFFLDAVMRACNSAAEFGMALVAFRLFELSLPRSFLDNHQLVINDSGMKSEIAGALCPTLYAFSNSSDLLSTAMVSLCNLDCPNHAASLFEQLSQPLEEVDDISNAEDLYHLATEEEARRKPFSMHPSWEASFRHMYRVTAACRAVQMNEEELSHQDAHLLASALSSTISSFTHCSQPEAGILLAKWVERISEPIVSVENETGRENAIFLPVTDSLLAAVIEACSHANKPDLALDVFHMHSSSDAPDYLRPLSSIATMKILFAHGRDEDAMSLFRGVAKETPSPDLFIEAARGLLLAENSNAAADLYRLALASGCVSEELSLLTLEAVSLSRGKGRIRVMRNIIEEIARIVGTTGMKWTEAKYWDLKHLVGFSNVSRLMWWNDPKTSRLDELDLALQVLDNRASSGLTPKNAALRIVVASAKAFHPDYIPTEKTGLPRLPRDRAGWVMTLSKVLEQAKLSTLYEDPNFIEDVALAYRVLGRSDLCVEVVNDAISRGMRVNFATLVKAVDAANSSGNAGSLDEIRMMLPTNKSSTVR